MKSVVKTIRFPAEILAEIRPVMDKNKINFTDFIVEAIKNYLRGLSYVEGINNSFAGWKSDGHPELKEGVDRYVRKMRKGRVF